MAHMCVNGNKFNLVLRSLYDLSYFDTRNMRSVYTINFSTSDCLFFYFKHSASIIANGLHVSLWNQRVRADDCEMVGQFAIIVYNVPVFAYQQMILCLPKIKGIIEGNISSRKQEKGNN